MWHDYLSELLVSRGATVMQEVRLSPWLPEGWGGRADLLIWDSDDRAFDLWDVKTVKGEGLQWVSEGAKDEHIWQLSAYWHSLRVGKFPMRRKAYVLYLPMNAAEGNMEPVVQEVTPIPKEKVWGVMEDRWAKTQAYLEVLTERQNSGMLPPELFLNEELAPPMERVQKLYKNGDKYELKLVPHWSTRFCEFDDALCDCSTQGTTKIGEWIMDSDWGANARWNYSPRKGFEDHIPSLSPR